MNNEFVLCVQAMQKKSYISKASILSKLFILIALGTLLLFGNNSQSTALAENRSYSAYVAINDSDPFDDDDPVDDEEAVDDEEPVDDEEALDDDESTEDEDSMIPVPVPGEEAVPAEESTSEYHASESETAASYDRMANVPLLKLEAVELTMKQNIQYVQKAIFYLSIVLTLGILLPILNRMLFGATPTYLINSRFYEIPCLRVLFYVILFFFIFCSIEGIVLTGALVYNLFCDGWNEELGVKAGVTFLITIATIVFAVCFDKTFVRLPDPIPQCCDYVRKITRSDKVSRKHLMRLGRESFPEMLLYGKRLGLWVRRLIVTITTTPFILLGIEFAINIFEADKKWEWAQALRETIETFFAISVKYIMDYMSGLPAIPQTVAIPAFIFSCFLFIFLMKEDKSYLIIRFPVMLLLVSVLACGLFYCFCTVYPDAQSRLIFLGVLDFIFLVRFYGDLERASNFLKEHRVMKPLSENFARIFPQAAEMKQRQDCELKELDMEEVARRIENGLHNVERYSFMALRNMVRFIGIVHAEQERFAAVRIRFMTVRRYVTSRYKGGTYAFYQNPIVPVWDEERFPLTVPDGYVNQEEINWLGSSWDIVQSCPVCGGTGRVKREEQYTDSNGKTHYRTYYETCSHCGGSGRVAYQQGIVTQWRRQIITSSEPTTSMPDYLADVEDRTYYEIQLIEDRTRLAKPAQTDGIISPDLVNSLNHSVDVLKQTQFDNYVQTIETFHDGRVYRSDVQAIGFWTLRIIFRRFFGKFGWFFGRTSEFYFRSIPLSMQSLLAVSVALPLFLGLAALLFWALSAFSINVLLN